MKQQNGEKSKKREATKTNHEATKGRQENNGGLSATPPIRGLNRQVCLRDVPKRGAPVAARLATANFESVQGVAFLASLPFFWGEKQQPQRKRRARQQAPVCLFAILGQMKLPQTHFLSWTFVTGFGPVLEVNQQFGSFGRWFGESWDWTEGPAERLQRALGHCGAERRRGRPHRNLGGGAEVRGCAAPRTRRPKTGREECLECLESPVNTNKLH